MGIEELYLAYREDVFRYLLSLTHSAGQAEDLLSETFLAALQGLGTFRGDSPVKTWLLGIARNRWLKSLRDGRREPDPDLLLTRHLADSPEERFLSREALGRVRELLREAEPRAADILVLRAHGWSYGEIARRWSISENSARVVDFRTKKRLRAALEKEGLL